MSRPRKYPQTTGYYVYCHITPDEMFYIGMSKRQPTQRWQPLQYETKSLWPYIEKYGWDSIRHVVLKDGLTEDQARKLEGLLIEEAKRQGFGINKNGSGGKWRDNSKECKREYQREYRQRPEVQEREREYCKKPEAKEYHREYNREYRQRPEVKEVQHEYNQRPEVKQRKREWQREYSKTEKYKVYQREYKREYNKTEKRKEYNREYQRQYRLKKKALKN